MPDRKPHDTPQHPPKPEPGIPPHILKELLDLREKVGRLEGMMEVLLNERKTKLI